MTQKQNGCDSLEQAIALHHPQASELIARELTCLNKVVYEVGSGPEDRLVARHLAARFTGRGWLAQALEVEAGAPHTVTFFGSMYRD